MDVQCNRILDSSEIKSEETELVTGSNDSDPAMYKDNNNVLERVGASEQAFYQGDFFGAMSSMFGPSSNIHLLSRFVGQELSKIVKKPVTSKLFRCYYDDCQFESPIKRHLKDHLIKVHSSRYVSRYACPLCSFDTDNRRYLKCHISNIHKGEKKFPCPYCDYRATQSGSLKKHIRVIHESGKTYVTCDICRFRTEDQKDLDNHVRAKHLGEKPFTCEICGLSFRRNPDMLKHKSAVHFKERPHQCILCDYKCSKRSALQVHLQSVHAGLRPFKCHLCLNKCYSNLKGLKTHINGFHFKIFPQFHCAHCTFTAKQKDYLKKHIFAIHRRLFKRKRNLKTSTT